MKRRHFDFQQFFYKNDLCTRLLSRQHQRIEVNSIRVKLMDHG